MLLPIFVLTHLFHWSFLSLTIFNIYHFWYSSYIFADAFNSYHFQHLSFSFPDVPSRLVLLFFYHFYLPSSSALAAFIIDYFYSPLRSASATSIHCHFCHFLLPITWEIIFIPSINHKNEILAQFSMLMYLIYHACRTKCVHPGLKSSHPIVGRASTGYLYTRTHACVTRSINVN